MEMVAALEEALLVRHRERGALDAEYAKMPASSGRTLRERERKRQLEDRLEQLGREISSLRLELKRVAPPR